MGVEPYAVLPGKLRALAQQFRRHGEGGAGGQGQAAHGAEGGIVVLADEIHAVAHDLVHSLHHGIRRQTAVLLGEVHAAAGEVHPHTQSVGCSGLGADQISGVLGEDVVVVKDSGAAVLEQLAHAGHGGKAHCVLVESLPDLVEGGQPVKELHILHLGQIPGEHLVQVMMGVDKTRIAEHVGAVNDLICLGGIGADGTDQPVLAVEVHIFVDPILTVAGDEGADVSDEQSIHRESSFGNGSIVENRRHTGAAPILKELSISSSGRCAQPHP